jgi:MFS transporter, ACS family, tartrate transporter
LPQVEGVEQAVLSKLKWRLLPFLFLLYIIAYIDRINVGFAALQMQGQLKFSDRAYGLGAGMFFAGYFLFQVPSNLVLHRLGARRWIAFLMVLWGCVSASMMFVKSPSDFYWFRFLLGSAEAGFFPGIIFYMKNWFPETARARAVALFMTAGPIAGVIGGPLSGFLLGLDHRASLSGWQWLFLLEGIPAVLMGFVVGASLEDAPSETNWLTEEQKSWLVSKLSSESGLNKSAQTANPFLALRGIRIWVLAFIYFALNMCSYGISLWLPTMIRSWSAVGNKMLGWIAAVPYLIAAIVMVMVGRHSDRTAERSWHVSVSAFAGAFGLIIAAHSSSIFVSIAAVSLSMTAVSSMVGPFWALPTKWWQGSAAAVGIAVINAVGNLGGFLGPYLIGAVKSGTGSYYGGFLAVAGALAIGGLLSLFSGRAENSSLRERRFNESA